MIPNSLPFVVDSYSTGHFIYIVNLKNIIFNIILIIETVYTVYTDTLMIELKIWKIIIKI